MPRNAKTRDKIVFKKGARRTVLPFFKEFLKKLVKSEDSSMYVCDLFAEYKGLVTIKTSDALSVEVAESLTRFGKQLNAHALKKKWHKITSPKRGYKVKLAKKRVSRTVNNYKFALTDQVLQQLTKHKDLRRFRVPASQIFVCKKTGRGLVANKDIPEGGLVCEYLAQELTEAEFAPRLANYTQRGMMPTDVKVGKKIFDGYADRDGIALDIFHNRGTQLNHCRDKPNCVMKKIEVFGSTKLFLFAKTTIPKGRELLWNYDDNRHGLEPWLYL